MRYVFIRISTLELVDTAYVAWEISIDRDGSMSIIHDLGLNILNKAWKHITFPWFIIVLSYISICALNVFCHINSNKIQLRENS